MDCTTIPARDGYPLAATVFRPPGSSQSAVLICSATAVPQKFYQSFAEYLATRGHVVITYDYRGIAKSRPNSLAGFSAMMRDWALLDVAAAIDHVRKSWSALPLHLVGHSFGGQALGLVPNNREVSRALLVAAQAGYWRLFASPERYRVYLMLCLLAPVIARIWGYAPGRLGLGEDIPAGVLIEWAGWVSKPRYFFDDPSLHALANFPRYTGPLRAIGLTDDPWATKAAIELLLGGFSGTNPELQHISPRDVGVDRIGHFGFFRDRHRDTLWSAAADWLGATA
jgi:predicted alpha/beta hydrolase